MTGFGAISEDALFGSPTTVTQEAMVTPEQQAAINAMLAYGKTGDLEGSTAPSYTGSLGSYNMTPTETSATGSLNSMLSAGLPKLMSMGNDTLKSLLAGNQFDPNAAGGIYSGFKKQTLREQQNAQDAMNRASGVQGNLYSTSRANQVNTLNQATNDTLTNKLAELNDTYAQRKLAAVPLAFQSAQQEQNMGLQKIGAGFQYGGLQRILDDQALKNKYNAWLANQTATQAKVQSMLGSLGQVGQGVQWGNKSVTLPSDGGLVGKVASGVASGYGRSLGGGI